MLETAIRNCLVELGLQKEVLEAGGMNTGVASGLGLGLLFLIIVNIIFRQYKLLVVEGIFRFFFLHLNV